MNFTESTYRNRLFQLVPRECFSNLKNTNHVEYLEKRIFKIEDDLVSIYWYSISFVGKEFNRLSYYESKKYIFDRELFRYKYIRLGKLELLYQLLEYVNQNDKFLFLVGNFKIDLSIEYIIYLIQKISSFYTIPIYFHEYESERIRHIQQQSSKMLFKLMDFRLNSYRLFFQIFYKGTVVKNYNLDPGVLEQIYQYTFDNY